MNTNTFEIDGQYSLKIIDDFHVQITYEADKFKNINKVNKTITLVKIKSDSGPLNRITTFNTSK